MTKSIQAIRGMNDLLPVDIGLWQYIEKSVSDLMTAYGYSEIRLPIVEQTALFARAIGDVTDIVEKEMYTFPDRNGDSLSLRPEGTAGCVRAGIEHGLFHNQQQRLWYTGPMFRHERPQKGRYRQFYQVGVEAYGFEGPDIDCELIQMTARFWRLLGLKGLRLELNSLGTAECRRSYREMLVEYYESRRAMLDEDSLRRLEHNPLRILDSKNPQMVEVNAGAPALMDHLDPESRQHFTRLCDRLTASGIEFTINQRLVRGLDYYSRTVFEWKTDQLGAQSAVCAGGRYDGLVETLGGRSTPAVGFAMGLERIIELVQLQKPDFGLAVPDVFLVVIGEKAGDRGQLLAEKIRDAGYSVLLNCGGGSLKAQMKRADKSNARLALLIGEDELETGMVTIKDLRSNADQLSVTEDRIFDYLQNGI